MYVSNWQKSKLLAYSAVVVPLILGGNLPGQVVYKDFDHDIVLNSEPTFVPVPGEVFNCSDFLFYEFVLNADGNHDFGIRAQLPFWSFLPSNYDTNSMELIVYNDNFVGGKDGLVHSFSSVENSDVGITLTYDVNSNMAKWNRGSYGCFSKWE